MVEALLESGGQEVAVAHNGQSRAGTPTEYSANIAQITPENVNLTDIQKFYVGQSIFITGGTGFLGKLLIEKLLRSCPGIANIYLLVRPKKGKNPHERTDELFDDPVISFFPKHYIKFFQIFVFIPHIITKHFFCSAFRDSEKMLPQISSSNRRD